MPTGNWIMARKVKGPWFDPNLLLATAGRGRTKLEYRSEGVVFSQGDAADSIFYILRGKIKIVVTSKQGKEAVVAVLGEGDFFGEGCLIAQPLRLATAASMSDATVMRVEKAEMLRLLHAEPDFAEVFTIHLSRSAKVRPPHQQKLDPLLASPMNQPPPSGGEFGGLSAIYLRLVFTGLGHMEESFELFELF